jgi:alpha-N-arabinofuranosidase
MRINPDQTREPISKYIYGQFIEHLGRCIYGGLWAEMLEDRKFYYAISDDYDPWGVATDKNWGAGPYPYLKASPWQVIGPRGTVTMEKDRAFVGEHTPAIHVPGDGSAAGIAQNGIAIDQGRKYLGHIWLAGDVSAAPVVVRMVVDEGQAPVQLAKIEQLGDEYRSFDLGLTAPVSSDHARLEIVSTGGGVLRIGTLSLMPVDNIKGWRPEVIALLKELNSPIYRWPGGNFVSGYDWHDGIGARDKRPPRKNPAWKGVEHNDVGIHEYMELMSLIGAEPFVSLNTGLGSVENAAAEVEYLNGAPDRPNGKLRAQNGHPEPYSVRFFAVGNEMYGNWQLGHVALEQYVQKHNDTADAIWKIDPKAQLVAVGSLGKWDQAMLKICTSHMNLLSEHIYCKEKTDVREHAAQLADAIRKVADAHRRYRSEIAELNGKDIRIAMDEWNYWYGDYRYGELACRYYQKDGLGVARGLHEYFRNTDLFFMANYAQTVNVLGCIKATQSKAQLESTGLVLKLYRQHFGTIPVAVEQNNPNLDASAAWTEDQSALTVAIVNSTQLAEPVALNFGSLRVTEHVTCWKISTLDAKDYNAPEKDPALKIQERQATIRDGSIIVPPYSVVMYRFAKS